MVKTSPICPKRDALPDGRCKHQLVSGCCALPDELTCVEWVGNRGLGLPAPKAARASALPVDLTSLRGFTSEDIDSFKAMGVEVCLRCEAIGELWLVPAYTGQARKELTPEHLATVLHAMSVFPGSTVTSVRIGNKPVQEKA